MVFELESQSRRFRLILDVERKPIEIERIEAAVSYLCVGGVLPPPITIEDPRITEGRLDDDRGMPDAEFMIRGVLNNLSDWERSSTNDSLVFRLIDAA